MTFLAPLFLLGTLAGAIPVLLHLAHRQRTREVPFPTLRFLRLSVERTRRRRRIDDLALLIARVGILVLLAVGLAGPTLSATRGLLGRGAATAVAIVVDNSGSMEHVASGRPRIETARQAAEQVLDTLREGDAAALLPTNGPIDPGHGRLLRALDTVRQQLVDIRPHPERADLTAKVAAARRLLSESSASRRALVVVSDNQAISWPDARVPDERGSPGRWPTIVVDVQGEPKLNAALRDLEVDTPAPLVDVPATARVEVVNPAAVPQSVHVELLLDGARASVSPTLNLAPGGVSSHEFRFTWDRPGAHRGEVRLIEDDGAPGDNHLYFTQVIEDQVAVAIVQPQGADWGFGADAFYLARALNLEGAIRLSLWGTDDLARATLDGQAVIYLVDVPAPGPALAQRLVEYVRGGGRLVWVLGKRVVPEAYESMNILVEQRLLPASIEAARRPSARPGESWSLADLDREHPALAPLAEPASLYRTVLVYEVFPQRWEAKSGGRVLVRLDDGTPLLTERAVGAGSVLTLGTGLHVSWTNLPVKPLFLPLMARLTFHLAGTESREARGLAGAPMTLPIAPGTNEIELTRPTGEVLRLRPEKDGESAVRYADTHDAGIYLARPAAGARGRPFAFAVNGDPNEVDADTLAPDSLRERLGPGPIEVCQPEQLGEVLRRLREGTSLAPWCLVLVLTLIVGETYLANRRGQATTAPTPVPRAAAPDDGPSAEALELLKSISR